MSSILRQSSSSLARITRSTVRSTACRSSLRPSTYNPVLRASRISTHQARTFSSTPAPKKKDDDKKKVEGKPAPGTENLYDGKTPLSPQQEEKEKSPAEEEE